MRRGRAALRQRRCTALKSACNVVGLHRVLLSLCRMIPCSRLAARRYASCCLVVGGGGARKGVLSLPRVRSERQAFSASFPKRRLIRQINSCGKRAKNREGLMRGLHLEVILIRLINLLPTTSLICDVMPERQCRRVVVVGRLALGAE